MSAGKKAKDGGKLRSTAKMKLDGKFWNNYTIEVTGLIYSVWGTIGAYDCRFDDRAGKNRAAICVAVLAMQHLCHPSRWNATILDSAVICGDSYYVESLKHFARKTSKSQNRFGLRASFKVFPHLWTVDFGESVCGIVYGARNRLTLSAALKLALEESRNVIIECNGITLAALAATDAYYVADPCWIGPPLFAADRGAIYALRCRNVNALVYAVTKMLNTNQRLGVHVTPLSFAFDREYVDADPEICTARRRILSRPLQKKPGKTETHGMPVPRAAAVPDEDSYFTYQQRLAQSATGDFQPIDVQLHRTKPALNFESANNALVSTRWRLNLGQARPSKRPRPPFDPAGVKRDSAECIDFVSLFEARHPRISIADLMAMRDHYPRVITFASTAPPPRIESLECVSRRSSFVSEQTRTEFGDSIGEMLWDIYKSYPGSSRDEKSAHSAIDVDVREDGGEVEDNPEMES